MNDDYIEILIDVFDNVCQHAKVLPSITIGQLINEILDEFDDLDRSLKTEGYAITMRGHDVPLDARKTLAELNIHKDDELIFQYANRIGRQPIPIGDRVFFQETIHNTIYPMLWQPALIGRPSSDMTDSLLLAVDLQALDPKRVISRRHARVMIYGDDYSIEALQAANPVYLNLEPEPIREVRTLENGDIIRVGKSKIPLIFVRLRIQDYDLSLPIATLLIEKTGEQSQLVCITQTPFSIGHASCTLNLPYLDSMPHNMEIIYNQSAKVFQISDRGRTGVTINGARISHLSQNILEPNSLIELGGCRFRFSSL